MFSTDPPILAGQKILIGSDVAMRENVDAC
jgi:hypothetical protein